MTTPPDTSMPWKGIAKVTAAFGLGLTALCASVLRQQRIEYEKSQRVRWTDANRWEK